MHDPLRLTWKIAISLRHRQPPEEHGRTWVFPWSVDSVTNTSAVEPVCGAMYYCIQDSDRLGNANLIEENEMKLDEALCVQHPHP